jgi:hypothetical protein
MLSNNLKKASSQFLKAAPYAARIAARSQLAPAIYSTRFAPNVAPVTTFSYSNSVLEAPMNVRFFSAIPTSIVTPTDKSNDQRKFSALSPDVIEKLREELEVSN